MIAPRKGFRPMTSKVVAAVLAATLLALVGCTLTGQGVRKDALVPPRIGGGEAVAPKRCVLRLMIAERPQGDSTLGEAAWLAADEQAIDAEARRALQANGLRIGRVSGELPGEVLEVLSAPPPKKIEPQTIILPDGDHALIDTGTVATPGLSLMLGQKDKVVGKVYEDARGFMRVTASFDGDDGVALRLVPELHHGPIQHGWGVAPGGTAMTPGQIVTKPGQKEEVFRDLACTVVLKPGQVLVMGGRHDKRGSLGDFLFGTVQPDGDRPVEKVVFVWVGRSGSTDPEAPIPPPGLVPIDPVAESKPSK
jgi:hypothetical protein